MPLEDVLKSEYDQQYEQYRWIAKQQALVFTLYTAMIAATFALINAFYDPKCSQAIPYWFLCILFLLGMLGIFISIALIYSRSMQNKTAFYIIELLIQMMEQSIEDSLTLSIPAIRFRAMPSTGGRFNLHDTGNIGISLAFIFGVSLILAGIMLPSFFIYSRMPLIYIMLVVIFSVLGIACILPKILECENKKTRNDHNRLKNVQDWEKEIRDSFKLK